MEINNELYAARITNALKKLGEDAIDLTTAISNYSIVPSDTLVTYILKIVDIMNTRREIIEQDVLLSTLIKNSLTLAEKENTNA